MLVTILVFLVVLSIIVFVHEVGHFYTARKLGIGVEEFGFGFPPRMFGIKKKGVLYSINWIPLGGFVKIKGESGGHKEDDDSFNNQPIWKRSLVLFAGVFMNWVLAFVLISIGYFIGLPAMLGNEDMAGVKIRDEKIQIIEVYKESAAENNLQIGDTVLSVDNQYFDKKEGLQVYLKEHSEQEFNFKIKRGKDLKEFSLSAREIPESDGNKVIGVGLVDVGIISYPWYRAPIEGIKTTVNLTYRIIQAFFEIISGLIKGAGAVNISGPVGVAIFTGKAVDMGWIYVLQFIAVLSINLAVINILPIPALDGGRLLFLLIEKIRRKPNNQKIETIIHNIGFSLLMLLVVLITYKDIVKYGGKIITVIKDIF